MIFTENLDHNPLAVTLERLPDGTAWLYLRKDAHKLESQSSDAWECNTSLCKLNMNHNAETEQSISEFFHDWWTYAADWTILQNPLPERDTLAAQKVQKANETCQALIYAGIDVDFSSGREHFSLTPNDQTNIDSMFTAVTLGATQYPYHADGKPCTMYSAVDITTLYIDYKKFVITQTTYCNLYKVWINRTQSVAQLAGIFYGNNLPADLADRMQEILNTLQAEIQEIETKLQTRLVL